ncbi:asparaginase [Helicobacter magdeburgensis]|uniref:Probable L-asparaginase n=1 Tax=Helicobacter magdeburgensis TaxID=471858 RepID=A0A4U8SX84_9HELI|nr:asparaginase [Helicobacter magdeburgensis]TLD91569.1 asparaginase [Helicobacter magdeburgensis]
MGYVTKTLWKLTICAMLVATLGCSDSKEKQQKEQKEQTLQDSHNTRHNTAKPNVVILATGGTIAGAVDSSLQTTGYQAGVLSIESLLQSVPELASIANLESEQIANIDSADMSDEIWLKLAKRVNALLKSSQVDGVVITHGTDTMEESAFFLHLVAKSDKPIVFVGAMRPSTALSADGPKNLYNAISLAASPESKGKGVMVVMNDRIQSARYVSKTHTLNVNAFASPNAGDMGYILDGKAFFYTIPAKPHTLQSEFDVDKLDSLPKVDILYSYANDNSQVAAQALFNHGTKGLVIAGSGAGSIHKNHKDMLKKLIQNGLVVVQSSRVNSGLVIANEADSKLGFISSYDLNPQKARVLLMLALSKTDNNERIAKIFESY